MRATAATDREAEEREARSGRAEAGVAADAPDALQPL